jgi:hypothetical protein
LGKAAILIVSALLSNSIGEAPGQPQNDFRHILAKRNFYLFKSRPSGIDSPLILYEDHQKNGEYIRRLYPRNLPKP